jgi:ligand-binding sensor domain-containing protein
MSGEIWIATSGEGIIRIKDMTSVIKTDNVLSSRLSSLHSSYVFQDSRGLFWIAFENQGLNMYDPVNDEVTIFNAPLSIGSNQISSICEDHDRNLFVGTLTNGLYKFNATENKFELIPHVKGKVLPVKYLLVDDKNRLLAGMDGEGIKIYNAEKRCLEDYLMKSVLFDFSRMEVHSICQDKMGNLWTGLFQKGVFFRSREFE